MLPTGESARQISGEPRQPRYERQLTPGAADKATTERISRQRGASEGPVSGGKMVLDGADGRQPDDLLQEDIAQCTALQDLNPEQALNLTDDDLSKLRKLLVEHVSTVK